MDLIRHLTFFVTIAEERHFGRAASRLGMSQPPLSQGLRRLERQVGGRLFDRSARGVELTDTGAELLPAARAAVLAAQRFEQAARRRREPGAAVRIGVAPQLRPLVSAALAAAVQEASGGRVHVRHDTSATLVELVQARRLELAVVRHPGVLAGLPCGPVVRVAARLLVPERIGGARRTDVAEPIGAEPVRRAARHGLPLAAPARAGHPAAHDLLVDTLARHGLTAGVVVAEDDRTALALVATGQAVAITTDPDLAGPGVRAVEVGQPSVPLRFRTVWPPDGRLGESARAAVDTVLEREAAGTLGAVACR